MCVCLVWEEQQLTEKTWPGLSYGNLRVSQRHHKETSPLFCVSNPLPGHTHSSFMKGNVSVVIELGWGCSKTRTAKKRTLSENFHLSPYMKAALAQSQGFGRPGVLSEDFDDN